MLALFVYSFESHRMLTTVQAHKQQISKWFCYVPLAAGPKQISTLSIVAVEQWTATRTHTVAFLLLTTKTVHK